MKLECPNCHSLVYSRKSKFCDGCGNPLSFDSPTIGQELDDSRKRQHELADAMLPRLPVHSRKGSLDSFKRIDVSRPVCAAVGLVGSASIISTFCYFEGHARVVLFAIIVVITIGLIVSINQIACRNQLPPYCPGCGANVTTVSVMYCFRCGKPVRDGRCGRCNVDESWSALYPFRPAGPIVHCPNCGISLNSNFYRWRPGD